MSEPRETENNHGRTLWLDFDGTVVEKTPFFHWRNPLKYPLRKSPGIIDFLDGYIEGGGQLGGVVSRRPEIRRFVTDRSIRKLGLAPYLGELPVILAGSEDAKADEFAQRTDQVSGIIDDYPNKIGRRLLEQGRIDKKTVLLGVVATGAQAERLQELYRYGMYSDNVFRMRSTEFGKVIDNKSFGHLVVAPLTGYNADEGARLGELAKRAEFL